jgi:hypothetical protein
MILHFLSETFSNMIASFFFFFFGSPQTFSPFVTRSSSFKCIADCDFFDNVLELLNFCGISSFRRGYRIGDLPLDDASWKLTTLVRSHRHLLSF